MKIRAGKIFFFSGTACLALMLAGCSVRKNTFLSRNFHNLTAYYNIYWNGEQSHIEADEILKEQAVDNYFNVLPVFKYGSAQDTVLISVQTARMIEKGVKAVQKHSISIRGKEYVKTVDNAYLLMGQGFFYKHDYSKARSVFNFVLSEFSSNPERYEAMLWIARTYILEEDFSMATSFISQVEAQPQNALMKKTWRDLPLVAADYLIKQEKFNDAVPYLQEGIQRSKDMDLKARVYFILGQISQNNGNLQEAAVYYKKCLRLNPPLDLVFNARLNTALCYDGASSGGRDVTKGLLRMLKDPKNKAYFGRIYYVLGEMSFKRGDDENAVKYMDLSIVSSQDDPARMLLAAKRLASYFYGNRRYIESQKYYEMAAGVVEYDDPDYYDIITRAKNLAELTVYYKQLTVADTLKQVGMMGTKEQRRYAEHKAKQYKLQEAARADKKDGDRDLATPGTSSWYFYNEQTRNAGLTEFNRKWGRRELEDLWFLSSKPAIASLRSTAGRRQEEEEEGEETETLKILTPADPEYYLSQLPSTDSAFRKLDSVIEPALYNIGMIYCDKLGENKEGEGYLTRVISEFPSSGYVPSACELLCKIYRQGGDAAMYKKYADILSVRFPKTVQNERVNNPDYYKDLQANADKVERLYVKGYGLYVRNDYHAVLDVVEDVEKNYPVNAYREQFLYIKMMSVVHTSGYKEMLPLAKDFLNSYPDSPLAERVRAAESKAESDLEKRIMAPASDPVITDAYEDLVRYSDASLRKDKKELEAEQAGMQTEEEETVKYTPAGSGNAHAVIIVCKTAERDPGVMTLRVEGFNGKFYEELDLTIEQIAVDDDGVYVLAVSSFNNLTRASGYKKMILNNDYVFGALNTKKVFEIGLDNLKLLSEKRSVSEYEEFYGKK